MARFPQLLGVCKCVRWEIPIYCTCPSQRSGVVLNLNVLFVKYFDCLSVLLCASPSASKRSSSGVLLSVSSAALLFPGSSFPAFPFTLCAYEVLDL